MNDVEERLAHLEKWTGAMLPIVFNAEARLNMLEGEPPNDMLKPAFVRRMSRRSLLTREDLDVVQTQVSVLFDRLNRIESLLEGKQNKIGRIEVKMK